MYWHCGHVIDVDQSLVWLSAALTAELCTNYQLSPAEMYWTKRVCLHVEFSMDVSL